MTTLITEVETLIQKANKTGMAVEALQYTQAALNAANALNTLNQVKREAK